MNRFEAKRLPGSVMPRHGGNPYCYGRLVAAVVAVLLGYLQCRTYAYENTGPATVTNAERLPVRARTQAAPRCRNPRPP